MRIRLRLSCGAGCSDGDRARHGTKSGSGARQRTQLAIWAAWLVAAALFVYCFQLISDKTIWAFVWDAPTQAGDLAVRMVPPDWRYIRTLGRPIWDTINIATHRHR